MKLHLQLPHEIFFEGDVTKIVAEAENGSFCLLPRHIDFATALVPGILSCEQAGGSEMIFATDRGILVKQGTEVFASVRNAVRGEDLSQLRNLVEREFHAISDEEKQARAAMARLETALARRFIDFQKHG